MKRPVRLALSLLLGLVASAARAAPAESWDDILAKARGETVYWNA